MKKIFGLSLVLVLVSSAAFAQVADGISVGGWGRAVFAPLISVTPHEKRSLPGVKDDGSPYKEGDGELFGGTGVSWANAADIEVSISGSTDTVGFQFGIAALPGKSGGVYGLKSFDSSALSAPADLLDYLTEVSVPIGLTDNNNVWVKPFSNDWLTIKVGSYNVDDLRGKITDHPTNGFENFALAAGGEDDIFARFAARADSPGAALYSKPVDPLFIGLHFKAAHLPGITSEDYANETKLISMFRGIQAGIGYNIEGIGLARLQFIGDPNKVGNPVINGAFQLTAVENLNLDLGFKISLPYTVTKDDNTNLLTSEAEKTVINNGHGVSLGATYSNSGFSIFGRVDTVINGNYEEPDGVDPSYEGLLLKFLLTPSYDLGPAIVGLTFGLNLQGASTMAGEAEDQGLTDWSQIGFGAFVKKGFGNGAIVAGVGIKLPKTYGETDVAKNGKQANEVTVVSIPVILEYSF